MTTNNINPILELLFARKKVRFVEREPEPWLVRADVASALGIADDTDAFNGIEPEWRDEVIITTVSDPKETRARSACAPVNNRGTSPGADPKESRSSSPQKARHTQKMVIISPAGAMFLAFRSRKPEAKAFVNWLLEEVLPEIAKYGVYVAGADPAEKCTLLWHRWRLERAREIRAANADLEAQGLKTIALFRELNQVELRDVLSFGRHAAQCAFEAGEGRKRVYTKNGMRRAYSDAVLTAALARLQPQLPWEESKEEKAS